MAILEQPPVPGQHSGVLEHIRAVLPGLPGAERRIAEHILTDPGKAIALSINEFAALCGVSQPTVSKFCRSIGISSYAALRLGLSHDFAAQPQATSNEIDLPKTLITDIASAINIFQSHADLPLIAQALLAAPHVDIWSAAEFAPAGALLADRLMALGIPAASASVPARWATRCAGLRPGSVIVLLISSLEDTLLATLAYARRVGARLLCCAIQASRRLIQLVDWLVPFPDNASLELASFALVEAYMTALQEAADIPGPAGPASPWRLWPHTRSIFLPTAGDPIPATLLMREDPPQPHPLILYFSGLSLTKEEALPGQGGTRNPICPRIISALLNAGYHVLVVDAQAHGARKRTWENTHILLAESLSGKGNDMLAAARAEAPFLVDGAHALGITGDTLPIAVVGQSWGGLQALYTLAGDTRIMCGISMMPVIHIPHLDGFTELDGYPRIVDNKPGAWMGMQLAPRPLLLLAGEQDTVAPPQYIQTFAETIRPAYSAAEVAQHLEYKVLPNVGHQYTRQMLEETLTWLGRYLPTTSSEKFVL